MSHSGENRIVSAGKSLRCVLTLPGANRRGTRVSSASGFRDAAVIRPIKTILARFWGAALAVPNGISEQCSLERLQAWTLVDFVLIYCLKTIIRGDRFRCKFLNIKQKRRGWESNQRIEAFPS